MVAMPRGECERNPSRVAELEHEAGVIDDAGLAGVTAPPRWLLAHSATIPRIFGPTTATGGVSWTGVVGE
jgi:hypothetical protein